MRGGKMRLHPAAPRGWVDWVVRSSFPSLDFLSILIGGGWPLRRITWLKNKKGAVRPMVGVLRLEKLLRQRRSCGLGDSARNPKTGVNTVYSIFFWLSTPYIVI